MGMYDTLNGEQVKCFPWYSFDVSPIDTEGVVSGHGGGLKYYGNGDKIPYRSLAYNYGKNFIIFDFNPDFDPNNATSWIAHVIEGGCLKASIYKENAGEEFEEMLKRSRKNISYYGSGNFKFKSISDINQYAIESDGLMKMTRKLYNTVHEIMREWMDALKEGRRRNLKKDTPECAEFSSRLKGSKICSTNSRLMPIPVSRTTKS